VTELLLFTAAVMRQGLSTIYYGERCMAYVIYS
jgi:hypothetical protein